MSDPSIYTVGWICAVETELVAAIEFLDEEHEDLSELPVNDDNVYSLGRMGKHNVAIAVLPHWQYGTTSAAAVARDMARTFPNLRIGLMVGIAGGAPSPKNDVRLGDVVVSSPGYGAGGVLQYDYGMTAQDKEFIRTGFLNQPPRCVLTAIPILKAKHARRGHDIDAKIADVLLNTPRLQARYQKPDPNMDMLFRASYKHCGTDEECTAVCMDASQLIARSDQSNRQDGPMIHYGLIASANQLMKDANLRDSLSAETGVLCFEMEAAGLMNHFPCVVIRGICDYADTHKNTVWQGYAAMAAAAYAKDLLSHITPAGVETEKKICDVLSDVHKVVEESRDIAKEGLQVQKDFAKERMSEKEEKCHQLFRLTNGSRDATYEWYKDRVEERVEGTCQWFLKHEYFQEWLKRESGPLLVSADPGCGKSVLTKYLIDHYLINHYPPRSAIICYFFFKDQDQNTVRQALCALLHQFFSQKPSLIKHAMAQHCKNGGGLINSTGSLWEVFRNAIKDPEAGNVIIILDALDECAESEFVDLMRNIERQYRGDRLGHGKLKYLLSSRPYKQIVSKFRGLLDTFPNIRIPGEDESETISQEVNRVITHRINQLSKTNRLSPQIRSHLEKKLQETTHRTYLWTYLVFDDLEKVNFKKTQKGVEAAIAVLPKSVNEAYKQILSKSEEDPMVLKALSIILVASRPLTLSEMNVAVNINDKSRSFNDLDLEADEDFKSRLRSCCGLFISIYHSRVYFLHQTAREFLLADLASDKTIPSELQWHRSITTRNAHDVLAMVCVLYLNFFNSDVSIPTDAYEVAFHFVDSHPFLDYSATYWGAHFREADIMDDAPIVTFALEICDPHAKSYSAWFKLYWRASDHFTDLMVASYFGLSAVVKKMLENGAEIEAKDRYGQTPLVKAIEGRYAAIVRRLLEMGAKTDYSYRIVSESHQRGVK